MKTLRKPVTAADELRLAKWLHKTYLRVTSDKHTLPWGESAESARANYLAVARELLTNPPKCLRRGR